jgi:DNA (cytosine-5)-methyltransferase 1
LFARRVGDATPERRIEGGTRLSSEECDGAAGNDGDVARQPTAGPLRGIWRAADWLFCRDGKWRPVEPSTFPLAHGITNRVGRLRAYGNAINATAAEAFIRAYQDTMILTHDGGPL